MNFLDRSIAFFSPQKGLRRAQARKAIDIIRKFEAGKKFDKKNKDWNLSNLSADAELFGDLATIRAKARDLYNNSPIYKRATEIIVGDVVGEGVTVDFDGSPELEKAFTNFADSVEIDVEGAKDFYDIQDLAIETIVHSGEVLIRKIVNPEFKYGVKFQILDPDFVDHTKNEVEKNGDRTIQGVKMSSTGVVLGYWIFDEHPGGLSIIPKDLNSKFHDSDEYLLVFNKTRRASAARGVVHTTSVLNLIKDVTDTFKAEVIRRKLATCMVGVIVNTNGVSDGEDEDEGDDVAFRPGTMAKLGAGEDIRFNTPPQVSDFSPFAQDQIRLVAMGFGVTYESLSMNLSNINFSSAKIGRINVRPKVQRWQRHILINQVCRFIAEGFKKTYLIKNPKVKDASPGYTAPAPIHYDPIAESNADKYAIRNGFKSLRKALKERGLDPEKALAEISEDQKMLDKYGLKLDVDPRVSSLAGNPNQLGDKYE